MIGKIVKYIASDEDKKEMEKLSGTVGCNIVDVLPAIVVNDWGNNCFNLQVLLDGNGTLWKTSVGMGSSGGYWMY